MHSRQKYREKNPYDEIFSAKSDTHFKNIEYHSRKKVTSFSTHIKVRKAGEKKFGNGQLSVKGDEINLSLKKFFGRAENFRFSRNQIDILEFRNKGVRFQSNLKEMQIDEFDLTLDITLKNENSFSIYIGEKITPRKMAKYYEICEILNTHKRS